MSFKTKFSNLGEPKRIWTVSAVNGRLSRLTEMHHAIYDRFAPGDRLVYTGNYLCGKDAQPLATLEELLHFRRTLLALPGLAPEDFTYLRGIQEELWNKILQIPFAPDPGAVLGWMAQHHPEMDGLLRAYGSSLQEAARIAREGVVNLTRWTGFLRRQVRARPGHEAFFGILHRAAFTENAAGGDNILFVHAGIDPARPLEEQGDSFWWEGRRFSALDRPYTPFKSVVRGFDPDHGGVRIGNVTISLDGGGPGGKVVCASLSGTGDVLELLAA